MKDLILEEIYKVQQGAVAPAVAADTIADWIQEEVEGAVEDTRDEYNDIVEDEEVRLADMEYASWTTGLPDMFSDEMRGFWTE